MNDCNKIAPKLSHYHWHDCNCYALHERNENDRQLIGARGNVTIKTTVSVKLLKKNRDAIYFNVCIRLHITKT